MKNTHAISLSLSYTGRIADLMDDISCSIEDNVCVGNHSLGCEFWLSGLRVKAY